MAAHTAVAPLSGASQLVTSATELPAASAALIWGLLNPAGSWSCSGLPPAPFASPSFANTRSPTSSVQLTHSRPSAVYAADGARGGAFAGSVSTVVGCASPGAHESQAGVVRP